MTGTPPPTSPPSRPQSGLTRPPRSNSRMSASHSRASDEDVKTSVKVAVRIRPPLRPTDPGYELIPQRFQRSMTHITSPTSLAVDSPQGRKLFVFDKVFGEDVTQEGVWDYVQESVGAFLQGYNVSVMAYGQSGAGKSFTMGTATEQGVKELMGVVPRAASALFEKLAPPSSPSIIRNGSGIRAPNRFSMSSTSTTGTKQEKTWQMKATYVEIYNEQLRDLLLPENTIASERGAVTIREDTKGRILLTGLHQVNINSMEDLMNALNFGSTIRQTDATAINAKSSRSHAVFSLNLVQRKDKDKEAPVRDKRMSAPAESLLSGGGEFMSVDSKLHFVDLAGSERMKNTGAVGDRAKEGISINAGLASLGKVISQLSSRQSGSHVSYRDSKLTRLLQDSLGGDAITYVIACVTPAEFHLSETLNTIQYAQRARAIQSKPKIQQVNEEGDKQAMIERLKAEVKFLRDQMRSMERGSRTTDSPQDRGERSNEREIDLQNHLLDVQENYSALSHRHAKLISEISKSRNVDESTAEDLPETLAGGLGESAMERLQRSNSFSEAVEQVVLEYEKTIQTLESSLSNTRSSLSSTESKLLEKETKFAYIETVNQQLQTRMQKLMDRESGTEQYLHDLEAKIDGRNVGEERASAAMTELRKELARMRENEATSEEYISTLEERLAEADQDTELMQRDIARLEHVIERQRSVGKLDNLLFELDHIQDKPNTNGLHPNGVSKEAAIDQRMRGLSSATFRVAIETPIPEGDNEDEELGENGPEMATPKSNRQGAYVQTPEQTKFVEEKLENVNQELIGLRVEHETTVNDYTLLSAKYEDAIRTLAALQQHVDDHKNPVKAPTAFLSDARVEELKNAGQHSSSRSLSSELSSVGLSPTTLEPSDEAEKADSDATPILNNSTILSHELENLKALVDQKERGMAALQTEYEGLNEQHLDTLDLVEELKAEVQKAKINSPSSPTQQFLRRKSSQNVMSIDRAHRSLAALGNMASEHFEGDSELKESFELHMGGVTHELHQRSEKVQMLETELAGVKREMELKMTIISGLTRERSSMKTQSPVDMTMFSSMRDQILQNEREMQQLRGASITREEELSKEVQSLKDILASHNQRADVAMPGLFPETPAPDSSLDKQLSIPGGKKDSGELDTKVTQLQEDLEAWETKHKGVVENMQTSEKKLMETISELESTLTDVDSKRRANSVDLEAQAAAFDSERQQHTGTIDILSKELEEHQNTISGHAATIASLEKVHADTLQELEDHKASRVGSESQLDGHKNQISSLEQQLAEHQAAVESHKQHLQSLQDSHTAELEEARSSAARQAQAESESQIAEISTQHKEAMDNLYTKTKELEGRLQEHQVALQQHKEQVDAKGTLISQLEDEKKAHSRSASTVDDNLKVTHAKLKEAEETKSKTEQALAEAQAKLEELNTSKSGLEKELVDVRSKEQRASRLVEELEGELEKTFERTQETSSRLSLMQNGRDQELAEARAATLKAQEEIAVLNGRLEQVESNRVSVQGTGMDPIGGDRSSTMSSQIRKSGSVSALAPSPPPAIPLPPLPTGSPPSSSGFKDTAAQRVEEQEARIRTIEKHLFAEKQLTATLEEALVDLETQGKKIKNEVESWKKKAWDYEDELSSLRKERNANRHSLQAVEEERSARKEAEAARAHLEERMAALNNKKKKSALNCF